MKRRTALRIVAAAAMVAVAGATAVSLVVGSLLVAPDHRPVRPAPPGLHPDAITIQSESGARLAAWLFEPPEPRGAIVVVHGIHANRGDMLGRARLMMRAGFAVLAPDLQAHGGSTGSRITLGFLEARDVEASIAFLRARHPKLRVGAIGVSMGGAAVALRRKSTRLDAAVLEAVYPTIEEALDNRVRAKVGGWSEVLSPVLLWQLRPRLGFGADALRPIEGVRSLGCPVLVISGSDDRLTTEAQTRALYAAASEPKELWVVPGAGHVDLLAFDPPGYGARVLAFLERHVSDQHPDAAAVRDGSKRRKGIPLGAAGPERAPRAARRQGARREART